MSRHRSRRNVVSNDSSTPTSDLFALVDSRREFIRRSAAAVLVSHPLFSALDRITPAPASARLTFKTQAQYQSEAAQFESAMQSFASAAAMAATTAAQIGAITNQVGIAAVKVDLYYSWMVATCAADLALGSWVRNEIRDQATLNKFVDEVTRNARFVDSIPGVDRLRTRLREMKAEKLAIQKQMLAKLLAISGRQATDAARKALAAGECAETWAIVTGALVAAGVAAGAPVVNGALVGAASAITVAAVVAAAAAIAARYTGTGAERIEQELKAATEAYQRCLIAASMKPPSEQSQATADCQAQLMQAQMAALT